MKARRAFFLVGAVALTALSCGLREPEPAALETSVETCGFCRMPVSDPRLAAQLSAAGEEAAFFDDIGCLRDYLREHSVDRGAVAYVADHRTRAWVPAAAAIYSRCPSLETPMGSHLMAHASAASRDEEGAAGCILLSAPEVFGDRPPDGTRSDSR